MENQLDYEINKELGECYLFMGNYDEAEKYYRKALTENPQISAPFMGLATIAVQRGELDNALVLYKKAASVEPDSKAYCGMGLVLMEQGKAQEAFDAFAKSLDMASDGIVALNGMVRTAYAADCVERAVPYLQAAIEADMQAEAMRVTLAGCFISLDRKDEARELLEKVLADNPANESARALLQTLSA
ncbi:tetratricopeptide repeat protein [uncultured Desulfovibrio sp.]|uniref:tetratricopeptide repeat protein n=1 Tax=uncultured Desulfovibrio sp. TaxID=167968 RepID=UPI00260699DE|nr:tetratricopeptide repeat protein [uncultured Desulfovibrio sp.]